MRGRWRERSGRARPSSTHLGSTPTPARSRPPTAGTRTGGDPRNRDYLAGHLDSSAAAEHEALCFDPADVGRAAGRRRRRMRRACWRPPAGGGSAPSRRASRVSSWRSKRPCRASGSVAPWSFAARLLLARSSRSCGPRATRSSSASTRSVAEHGPGPLMVGAAILPRDTRVLGVRDSKMLTEDERERALRSHRRVVLGVVGRRREPGGVRRARHDRSATPRRAGARSTGWRSCPTSP